jgi:DNA-binding GntR family transcriptional regulator
MSQAIERTAAPLRQQVVKRLREDILTGAVKQGQRLIEGMLCDAYGVSRTVVREALRQLESEHLIRVLPGQGPIVTVLTETEIRSIYVVRASLEGLAGRLFATNASADHVAAMLQLRDGLEADYRHGGIESREVVKATFYRLLLQGGGNAILEEALRSIHARVAMFRRFAFIDSTRVALSMDELNLIIDAAAVQRDPDAAWRACENHIVLAGRLAIIEYARRADEIFAAPERFAKGA